MNDAAAGGGPPIASTAEGQGQPSLTLGGTAACGDDLPSLFAMLDGELLQTPVEVDAVEHEKTAELVEAERILKYTEEFKAVFPAWMSLTIDWKQEFAADLSAAQLDAGQLDVMTDLIRLPIGKLYQQLAEKPALNSDGNPLYGHMPHLAKNHIGQDQAESVCERVLSVANQVMTDGNTLLNDRELRQIVILRMNREFIFKYREIYRDEIMRRLKLIVKDPHMLSKFTHRVYSRSALA